MGWVVVVVVVVGPMRSLRCTEGTLELCSCSSKQVITVLSYQDTGSVTLAVILCLFDNKYNNRYRDGSR